MLSHLATRGAFKSTLTTSETCLLLWMAMYLGIRRNPTFLQPHDQQGLRKDPLHHYGTVLMCLHTRQSLTIPRLQFLHLCLQIMAAKRRCIEVFIFRSTREILTLKIGTYMHKAILPLSLLTEKKGQNLQFKLVHIISEMVITR